MTHAKKGSNGQRNKNIRWSPRQRIRTVAIVNALVAVVFGGCMWYWSTLPSAAAKAFAERTVIAGFPEGVARDVRSNLARLYDKCPAMEELELVVLYHPEDWNPEEGQVAFALWNVPYAPLDTIRLTHEQLRVLRWEERVEQNVLALQVATKGLACLGTPEASRGEESIALHEWVLAYCQTFSDFGRLALPTADGADVIEVCSLEPQVQRVIDGVPSFVGSGDLASVLTHEAAHLLTHEFYNEGYQFFKELKQIDAIAASQGMFTLDQEIPSPYDASVSVYAAVGDEKHRRTMEGCRQAVDAMLQIQLVEIQEAADALRAGSELIDIVGMFRGWNEDSAETLAYILNDCHDPIGKYAERKVVAGRKFKHDIQVASKTT